MTFRTSHMEKGERQRLWDLLFHEAQERGADAFSIQPDTTHASSGYAIGSEPLMLYLRSIPPRWRWNLRPRAWPLDDESRRWLRALGTQAFQITLWNDKRWVLRTDLWGRTVAIVLPHDRWEELERRLAAELGEIPGHSIQKWRSLEPREAGGWAVPKRLRWALAGMAAIVALVVGVTFGWEEGFGALLLTGGAVVGLPQHEPTARDRLMVRSGSLVDPIFGRRAHLAANLGTVGLFLVLSGAAGVGVSEPGWEWRPLCWALMALGGLTMVVGATPAAMWLWRRRSARVERPTPSQPAPWN